MGIVFRNRSVHVALILLLLTAGAAWAGPFAGGPPRSSDNELARYAEQVPGFGGLFYDADGKPNVYLADLSRASQIRALGDDVRVLQGEYDFRQLLGWRAELRELLSRPDVVMIDVDERHNRVLVGFDLEKSAHGLVAEADLRGEIERRGVPVEAVRVQAVEPIRPLASLRDRVRPVPGGVQIAFSSYVCTHGFNAYRNNVFGFVTNSHCSGTQGGVQSTVIYQNTNSGSNRVGVEIADPTYWSGSPCPSGRVCRYSDSAFIDYDTNSTGQFARIARTTSRGTTTGSLTISTSNPRFTITADAPYPVAGQQLNKMGRTTGWTYGSVTNTCVDISVSGTNITLLCQELVNGGSQGGDSGSPVFTYSGNNATLYGILWGGSGTSTWAMSAFDNVEYELGNLTVR